MWVAIANTKWPLFNILSTGVAKIVFLLPVMNPSRPSERSTLPSSAPFFPPRFILHAGFAFKICFQSPLNTRLPFRPSLLRPVSSFPITFVSPSLPPYLFLSFQFALLYVYTQMAFPSSYYSPFDCPPPLLPSALPHLIFLFLYFSLYSHSFSPNSSTFYIHPIHHAFFALWTWHFIFHLIYYPSYSHLYSSLSYPSSSLPIYFFLLPPLPIRTQSDTISRLKAFIFTFFPLFLCLYTR